MERYLYSELSGLVQARLNCDKQRITGDIRQTSCQNCQLDIEGIRPFQVWRDRGNNISCPDNGVHTGRSHVPVWDNANSAIWFEKHEERIEALVKNHMPSGSGFDSGTTIDLDSSHADKLVFRTHFHHLNPNGFYEGWTYHKVIVTPALVGHFHLRITGPNRDDIKEAIHFFFSGALMTLISKEVASNA